MFTPLKFKGTCQPSAYLVGLKPYGLDSSIIQFKVCTLVYHQNTPFAYIQSSCLQSHDG